MNDSPLHQFSTSDWASTLDAILPDIHDVDRSAARIWSYFYPLALDDAYAADEPQTVTRRLRIDGNARLSQGQVDSSHWFLYGHRYWPAVKAALVGWAGREPGGWTADLLATARALNSEVAARAGVDARLVAGISFVGLMTLRQAGFDAVRATLPTASPREAAPASLSPDAIVAARAQDESQGPFGFLRSTKRFSVIFDERRADAHFPILDMQHLTTAAAADTRDYTNGPRRFQEGPIPAQCRSATCGTCWVGVLGGQDKLSDIDAYESRRLKAFGYIDPQEAKPIIRLACQARASGNVTIVIPTWHGFVARLRSERPEPSPADALS